MLKNYNFQNLRVVFVDDNFHMHSLVRQILGCMKIKNVRCFETTEAALVEIKAKMPDIILVDFEIKPMNGVDFIRHLRTTAEIQNPFAPMLMITAHSELPIVKAARDAGANYTIAKPISVKQVYSTLVRVVEDNHPFIKTKTYFGPDRRRKQRPFEGEDRRKSGKSGEHEVRPEHSLKSAVVESADKRKGLNSAA